MKRRNIKLEIVTDDTRLLCDEEQCPYIRKYTLDAHASLSCALFERKSSIDMISELKQVNESAYGGGPVLRMQACHEAEVEAKPTYTRAEHVKVGDVVSDVGLHASRRHKVLRADENGGTYQITFRLELLETDGVDPSLWLHTVNTWKNTCIIIRDTV